MQSSAYTIVSIEGNIGSGKSTLLANLREIYKEDADIVFLNEPVDEWGKITDENGVTILEKFYADQEKYSFPFQMMAYVSRLKVLRCALRDVFTARLNSPGSTKKVILITERSLFTDKLVFAKMLYDDKKIYVKTDPEQCHTRIAKRSRDGEANIPLEYLQNCSRYHDNMLDTSSSDCVCGDQLILNGNVDIYENKQHLDNWISDIDAFIKA